MARPKSIIGWIAKNQKTTIEKLRREMAPPDLFYEPGPRRYHLRTDCQVLVKQNTVELVLCKRPPVGSRPCSICATVPEPCD